MRDPDGNVIASDSTINSCVETTDIPISSGGTSARIDKHCYGVTYIHRMFDQHRLVFAEGAPSESFYPRRVALGIAFPLPGPTERQLRECQSADRIRRARATLFASEGRFGSCRVAA